MAYYAHDVEDHKQDKGVLQGEAGLDSGSGIYC